jgi:translation initiation factor 2B subunit (eIF-2B alpha/beta/delta family)
VGPLTHMGGADSLPSRTEEALRALAAHHHVEAVELARQGGEALLTLIAEAGASTDLPRYLWQAGRRLVAAQPAMAPLLHLANVALQAWEQQSTPEAVAAAVRAFQAGLQESVGHIADQAAAGLLLLGEGVVLTLGYSPAVVEALRRAHRQGARLYVLCCEARPLLEGREAARALAAAGIPVTLLVDAAGPAAVAESATAVWLGAESIAREGLFSQVGSYGLVLAAREAYVPVHALADDSQLWPDGTGTRPASVDRDPLQVWEKPPPNLALRNRSLERTPLEWLSGVITPDGVRAVEEILARLATLPVHPGLV